MLVHIINHVATFHNGLHDLNSRVSEYSCHFIYILLVFYSRKYEPSINITKNNTLQHNEVCKSAGTIIHFHRSLDYKIEPLVATIYPTEKN